MTIKLPESNSLSHLIEYWDYGIEPKEGLDAAFPRGRFLDYSQGAIPHCTFGVPYPARRCGHWTVKCFTCGCAWTVQTTGRMDDPVSVKVACRKLDQPGGER